MLPTSWREEGMLRCHSCDRNAMGRALSRVRRATQAAAARSAALQTPDRFHRDEESKQRAAPRALRHGSQSRHLRRCQLHLPLPFVSAQTLLSTSATPPRSGLVFWATGSLESDVETESVSLTTGVVSAPRPELEETPGQPAVSVPHRPVSVCCQFTAGAF